MGSNYQNVFILIKFNELIYIRVVNKLNWTEHQKVWNCLFNFQILFKFTRLIFQIKNFVQLFVYIIRVQVRVCLFNVQAY